MDSQQDEFVFVALGGLGEIGMNAALYGFGPRNKRKWLMVDCGVAFAGPDLPGVDLIMADVSFVEKIRKDLVGLVITHAHEDHIGAIASLWPKLGCKVYATRFAAGLLQLKRLSEHGAPQVPIIVVEQGAHLDLAPFDVELIAVAHSIPESCALAIRTPLGIAVHSGDWKIDATPLVGRPTDEARLRALGEEGVLALICDSTNILREGESPSEADVAKTLTALIAESTGRVVVTTFASNISRIRSVAEAAAAAGRSVVVLGRAMDRAVDVAGECGYLDGLPEFLPREHWRTLPRNRIVAIATGSQGEPRAALARIAQDDYADVKLSAGDRVIMSSRTIPGNEKAVGAILNGLIEQGVELVTDRTALVHVSGHPRRAEVAKMYDWVKPNIAIPAHGEAQHLTEHLAFARARGVAHPIPARNGDVVVLAPGAPAIAEQIKHGRVYKDGNLLIAAGDAALQMRGKLAFAGIVTVAFALSGKGDLVGVPDVVFAGVPTRLPNGAPMDELIDETIFSTFDSLPRGRRRDADVASNAVEKAVRNVVYSVWGKKPMVHVLVVKV